MIAIAEKLRTLDVPTLIAWGDSDSYFSTEWARWLGATLPLARVESLKQAKLFFPEERPDELCALLRAHWAA